MFLIIDNYDSFTYNLSQALAALGVTVKVFRNDRISIADIRAIHPRAIVISPGPGRPAQAGITNEAILSFAAQIPILGVCLGHQAIGDVFGARLVRASEPIHGKKWPIFHRGRGLFQGVPNPIEVGRYHSLLLDVNSIPDLLTVEAYTVENEVMAIRHRDYPVFGVQFHPESILTPMGARLLENFVSMAEYRREAQNACCVYRETDVRV